MTALESKCKVILPPEVFDFKQQPEPPVVFLAGAIDMGKAADWQKEVIESLADIPCVALNPRRKDWDCVDSETMALTPEGPKPYSELHVGDLIFTFSQDRDMLEVQTVEKMNVFEIDDELVEFTRKDCSFFFTENHELLDRISIRHNRTKKVKAGWFLGKNDAVRFPAGKSLEDVNGEEIIPYGRGFSDDHFRLAAWVLAEGSVFVRKDTGATQVSIAQYKKNGKKVEEIEELLNRLEMNHRYDNREFILDKDSSDFIVGIMGLEKYKIPAWVKDSPIRQRKIFVYEYAKGDGCMVGERISYICFGDRYRSFAKEMMVLCYGSGIGIKWRDKTSGFGHPVINLVPHNEDKKWFCLKSKGKVPYKGVVWCPTTKNGTWVAYRNGLPFITGNSSWKQEIGNEKFREQVEWELKGLEQANLIALCFTKESKAPISFLEMGLHISEGRMIVHCPEGFYRKGNVDIVCARYGVPVLQDFEDFKREVKRRLGEPVMRKPVMASDRVAWKMLAREFIAGMNMASNTKKLQDAFDGDLAYFEKWCNPKRLDKLGYKTAKDAWEDNPVLEYKITGWAKKASTAGSNHKDFATKREALKFLEDHALMSVGWKEGSKEKEACYWNGKVHITDADAKKWASDRTAGMGDTHPFGSPLRGRPDYGERDGEVGEVYGLKLPSEGIMTSNDHTAAAIVDIRKDAKEIAQRVVDENKPFMGTVSGTTRFLTLHKTYSEAKVWAARWEREVCMLPERQRMSDDEKLKAGLIPYVSMAADFTPIRLEINRILSSRVSTASDSMRVRIVADRIVATVKEFTGRE